MKRPIIITKEQAIEEIEENLKRLKQYSNRDKFLMFSYDLKEKKALGKKLVNRESGEDIIKESKTFVLAKDKSAFPISTLSMYTEHQNIRRILPIGIKHDVILFPSLSKEKNRTKRSKNT